MSNEMPCGHSYSDLMPNPDRPGQVQCSACQGQATHSGYLLGQLLEDRERSTEKKPTNGEDVKMDDKTARFLTTMAGMKGGRVDHMDEGSGVCVMSSPLADDHWLTEEKYESPPAPFRMGNGPHRLVWKEKIRAAGKYAMRATTRNGKEEDFCPDAWLRNLVVGMLGFWTTDGWSNMEDREEQERDDLSGQTPPWTMRRKGPILPEETDHE